MNILFLTNVPSPYRVDFFNELGKKSHLVVLFEKMVSEERDKSWGKHCFTNFEGISLKGKSISTDKSIAIDVISYIKFYKNYKIIVSNALTPTGMIAIQYMKIKKIPYFIEGDGGFAKTGKGIIEKIKKHFIAGAEGYFSTARSHDEYYQTYGASNEKIYRYPFTSLKKSDVLIKPLDELEKIVLRKKLNIKEKYIVLSVGQFIYRKGYDVLLEACKDFSNDVGVYIVGGKPTEEYINIVKNHHLDNVHFIEFQDKEKLKDYYKSADVFVLPTREDIWGLVINEAMACACPVITTDRCIAGLELIQNGKNGFIIPIENSKEILEKTKKILNSNNKIMEMGKYSLKVIKRYTIENMVEVHINILENDLKEK